MSQTVGMPYPISDFLQWKELSQLVLVPKFQRRSVWKPKAKSYLVDTILSEYPIAPLFLRLKIDARKQKAIREVVDGQQRLRAVFEFIADAFPILPEHNSKLGGKYFSDLSEKTQSSFLKYKFNVYELSDISDQEVLAVFARLNTYTVPLNAQELRNAEFFGRFKRTVYELAGDHYEFWRSNRIFSDDQIARMREAEFVSILLATILNGIGQTKRADLEEVYERYDEHFSRGPRLAQRVRAIIDMIAAMMGEELRESPFRRAPLIFSLFVLLYDARYGLPKSRHRRVNFSPHVVRELGFNLSIIGEKITADRIHSNYRDFAEASKKSTADPGTRGLRHEFLWTHALLPAARNKRPFAGGS